MSASHDRGPARQPRVPVDDAILERRRTRQVEVDHDAVDAVDGCDTFADPEEVRRAFRKWSEPGAT